MYQTDLARIHHEGFTRLAREAAPGLLRLLRDHGIRRGTVVDWGCGSGVWLAALIHAGSDARGIDASAALIRLARRSVPAKHLRVGSLHRTPLPPCSAITALGEVLSYLPAPPLRTIVSRAAKALRPGGLFIFDLMMQTRAVDYRSWAAGDGWVVAVDSREDRRRRRIERRITSFVSVGRLYRRRHERHTLRRFREDQVRRTLLAAGFVVETTRRFGRHLLGPGRLGFVAEKMS